MTELYVHIPYCKKKCDYCSFYSIPREHCDDDYVVALLREANNYPKQKINSLYFGGGTPTLLSNGQFEKLLNGLKERFDLSSAEISSECNPDTASREKLEAMRSFGINRLSIGVQSLNDATLKAIGRIHDSAVAISALETAVSIFDNVNADYMVGLPFQTIEDVRRDIKRIIQTGVKHVSVYSLILEEEAPLFSKVESSLVTLPDEDKQVEYYEAAREILIENDFRRYEISNFALPGYECKHNSAVWRFGSYIGLGAAAHSFYEGKRYFNVSNVELYTDYTLNGKSLKDYVDESEEGLKVDFIMLALRTARGLVFKEYNDRFSTDFKEEFKEELETEAVKRTCDINESRIVIKDEYFYVSNSIIESMVEKYL
ncbi:MAG: radical SAM family heme chaperone HemW [Clostridia bacterium]|nr:radical SAM family heme chaperone HemW [Clostridia bacterium]